MVGVGWGGVGWGGMGWGGVFLRSHKHVNNIKGYGTDLQILVCFERKHLMIVVAHR